jgi:hypothetical protein
VATTYITTPKPNNNVFKKIKMQLFIPVVHQLHSTTCINCNHTQKKKKNKQTNQANPKNIIPSSIVVRASTNHIAL